MEEKVKPVGKGFLEESSGNKSLMRALSIVALLGALWFGHLTITQESEVGIWVTSMFVIGAFAPKAIQKYTEVLAEKRAEK